MKTTVFTQNDHKIALLESAVPVLTDPRSATDLMMSVKYETGCDRIALNKDAVAEEFFILSSGLAGEVLQKFINYQMKFAVYGEFGRYTSKPLHDFIRESNRGNDVYFTATADEAVAKLAAAR